MTEVKKIYYIRENSINGHPLYAIMFFKIVFVNKIEKRGIEREGITFP